MKTIFRYLKGYVKESILGPLFKLFEATLELIVPLIIAKIIDNGILESNTQYTVKMCILLVVLGVVGLLFSVTAQYFAAKASVGFVTEVRGALFSKMQTLSYTDIDNLGTSTMIGRMTQDTSKVQTGLNLALRLLLRSPFVVFGAAIMAYTVNKKATASFIISITLLSIVVYGIMLITMPIYKRVQKGTDSLISKTRENLSGARVIRAFRMENEEISSFSKENDSLTAIQKRVGMISSLMNPLTYIIINLGILLLIETGALEVKAGTLTQGQVVALYNYMSQILVELIKLANLIISISKAMASANRIADVLNMTSTERGGSREYERKSEYAVEFENVSFRYSSSKENSLSNISLKVGHGESLGIIGATGAGKSTFINLIPGFYHATEGNVLINGEDVATYSPQSLRSKIGIVPQKAVLFKGSIKENILWGKNNATEDEVNEALKIAQALDVVNTKGGMDAIVEQGGKNLSGGQRQRLTIARALVSKPDILILDDSASALDFATDAALREALKSLDNNTTLFIVSQRASSVMGLDKILVLDDGEMLGLGTHEELLKNCQVYKEIYDSQFRTEDNANG